MLVTALSNIKFNNITKTKLMARTSLTFNGGADSFVKTLPIKEENEFIVWARRKDLGEVIKKSLQNPENKIGKGFYSSAYKIEGNDDYIFRIKHYNNTNIDYHKIEIQDTENKELDVNIGQQVAEITVTSKDETLPVMYVEVLKKQNGKSIGIPPSEVFYNETGELKTGELHYEDISNIKKYAQSLQALAQLPIKAYENLIDTVQKASKCGFLIDYYNSNNILVDEQNQSINLIDMNEINANPEWGNVLYALSNIYYFKTYYDSPYTTKEEKMQALNETLEITNKYIQAMKNKHVKFNKDTYTIHFQKFLDSLPGIYFLKTFDLNQKWAVLEQMGVA